MRKISIFACLAMVLGCSGASQSTSTSSPDDDRSLDDWIAALDDPASAELAALKLRDFVDRDGSQKAIEPLLRVWERDDRMPSALETAIALAAGTRGGPYWQRVLPTLHVAMSDATVSDARSLKSALVAVEALARIHDRASVPELVEIANRSVPDLAPGHRLRLAAISALGGFGDSRDAVSALIGLLRLEPSHRVQVIPSAAALALGETRSPDAVVPLLEALVRLPSVFPAARRALVSIGKPAIPELIALLQGRQERLNEVARLLELNVACDRDMGLGTTCPAPGLLSYRAATLLGDFHAPEAVTPLLDALQGPAVPVFFATDGPGPDHHVALLEALRQTGSRAAAEGVWAYARAAAHKDENRAVAIEVYSELESDTAALPVLAQMLADPTVGTEMRAAVARGYAQIVRDASALQPMSDMLSKSPSFLQTSDKAGVHTAPGYLARALVGASCKADPNCYMAILDQGTDQVLESLGRYISDLKDWSKDDRRVLADAARGRAWLELGKLGTAARPILDSLLERSASTNRGLRGYALAAIVRIAELPCDRCVSVLSHIVDTEREDVSRSWMVVETQIVRDYFMWAGR